MFGLGTPELIVIGIIVFLIFGGKRIPEIGKGLGGAIREFRHVKKEVTGKDSPPLPSLTDAVKNKVVGQIPGAKQIMDLKDKVEKIERL